ncbi:MAG: helix-turn-helix domain-containing protein [Bacteroidales bacterium]|nr:helix-turn-helix domain-containing protein [Bacteroidales bacterium]
MKQPELGRKILELRKAKGLTQDELVEKCNISVRTLQRIEAGEVTPRSYTVRIIFEALDYNFFGSKGSLSIDLHKAKHLISSWSGQFYKYFLDLFNLKTNTMRKLMILSIPFVFIFTALLLSSAHTSAQKRVKIRESFEVASSNADHMRWFNSGKIDSVCMNYHNNATMMPDQYPSITGKEEIAAYWLQLYNRGLRFTDLVCDYKTVSDSIAVERGTWTMSVGQGLHVSGNYLAQWRYSNGSWKIENEMSRTAAINGEQ